MLYHYKPGGIVFLVITLVAFLSCVGIGCGGSAAPTTPANIPISIEGLDGTSDVAVDASFKYTFSKAVNTSTVGTSTFFIVEASQPAQGVGSVNKKAALDEGTCDVSSALAATVSCSSSTVCELDPANDLSEGTSYSICLLTTIMYADGSAFEGYMATFETEGTAGEGGDGIGDESPVCADAADCEAKYDGSCNPSGDQEPGPGNSWNYDDLIDAGFTSTQIICLSQYASEDELAAGCMTYEGAVTALIAAGDPCGLGGGGGDTRPDCGGTWSGTDCSAQATQAACEDAYVTQNDETNKYKKCYWVDGSCSESNSQGQTVECSKDQTVCNPQSAGVGVDSCHEKSVDECENFYFGDNGVRQNCYWMNGTLCEGHPEVCE